MDTKSVVEAYLATWNAEGEQRAKLLAAHWAPDVTYTDPLADVSGHAGLTALIDGVRAQFPGWVFTPVGEPDGHHGRLRFRWGLGAAGEEPTVVGFDVLVLDGEGRIREVLGFLDKVPAGALAAEETVRAAPHGRGGCRRHRAAPQCTGRRPGRVRRA